MIQPQPNAREKRWQLQCRRVYPDYYILHHCQERNTIGEGDLEIGHLFVNMLHPMEHGVEYQGIHADPDRREAERKNFTAMCQRVALLFKGEIELTREEYKACLNYSPHPGPARSE